jgi:hypothetical protein
MNFEDIDSVVCFRKFTVPTSDNTNTPLFVTLSLPSGSPSPAGAEVPPAVDILRCY